MEKSNKRYIEIDSCLKCEHNGHVTGVDRGGIVFFCDNPAHLSFDLPKELVGKIAYPIVVIEQFNKVHMCPIPSWCTLPKKLDISE